MAKQIPESDWKLFRELSAVALERFCERVLSEIARRSSNPTKSAHERYLIVFKLLRERAAELAATFDDPRRSNAMFQLAAMRSQALLTEEEFARFSAGTRAAIASLLEVLQ